MINDKYNIENVTTDIIFIYTAFRKLSTFK